ncbi:hypothetical protein MACJ_001034 [Theileria orientalis]|uniref:Uncharacterized protein n=1 Tax=Theileria orientalis TaxID=68886 RepID=A0A976QS45_THEOR|nr:hypothetical protein MACJ_001034 [Theileria orientalis]
MLKSAATNGVSVYKDECVKYMTNFVKFVTECCGLDNSKRFNRVDLKKSILNSTRGRSITKFIQTLSMNDKKDLLKLSSMECPVTCPNKKVLLRPIESMPSNIMKSSKKLRNFFGIPELQVCRGCSKKSRCRRYQQVEHDVPDLSDLASVMIGMYSICKIHLDGNELVVPEFAFRELQSVTSLLGRLNQYFKDYNIETNIPRGDDKACMRELQRSRKEQEIKKLELLKEKVFNIPPGYNIVPKKTSYMTGFQRDLYNKLFKKKRSVDDDYIWVSDTGDTTLPDESSKLERINKAEIELKDGYSEPREEVGVKMDKIEDLTTNDIQFRMEYSTPLGSEVNLQRYDVMNERMVRGIKINAKGRYIVDLEENLENRGPNHIDYRNDGISMYKVPTTKKLGSLSSFISNLDSCPNDLSFLKRVPYNYQCQSSGESFKSQAESREEDKENLVQIALALDSKNK